MCRFEQIRHASDYDDFYIANKEEAKNQVELAEILLNELEEYCNKVIDNN